MLITPGDLIPVQPEATTIPWTRRKSQILNYLHRGPVTFSTLVYDTNVGDISSLATYFNPERVSVKDLNSRFGQHASSGENSRDSDIKVGAENVIKPRLLLYPEHNLNNSQVNVQRTLKWVLSHQDLADGLDSTRPTGVVDNHVVPPTRGVDNIASNLSSIRLGSTDTIASSTDNLSTRRSGSFRGNVRPTRRSSGPHGIGDVLNSNQYCIGRPVSRPASISRLTPIGQALNPEYSIGSDYGSGISRHESGSGSGSRHPSGSIGVHDSRVRPTTLPNLGSALDSVWRDSLSIDMSISHDSLDKWPVWEPTTSTGITAVSW